MKKIAISGSSGFLGSYLAKRLEKEFELVLLTRESNKLNEIKKKFPNLTIQIIDWNNLENIKKNFNDIQIFIHAGAMLPTRASANDKKIIDSSLNIVQNIYKSKIKLEKFIFISTLRTCIDTNNKYFSDDTEYNFFKYDTQYGRSKFLTERFLIKNKNFPLIICAPAHIVGPEKVNIAKSNDVILKMLNKKIVFITKAKYSIIHINDVCEYIYKIVLFGKDNEKYLLANQNPTLEEIANIIEKFDRTKKIKIKIPLFLINILSLIFEILNKFLNLKNVPLNRSTYHFIKIYKNFEGERIKKFNINFKDTTEIIKEIYDYQNSKGP